MARKIADIQKEILLKAQEEYAAIGVAFDPAALSKFDIENLWSFVVAVSIFSVEKMWDAFKALVESILSLMKPHTLKWYAKKALDFQYGYALVQDEDYYDNSTLTQQQIDASMVVKYAAAVEIYKGLRIKIAGTSNGDLAPLDPTVFAAFKVYMQRIKDAGVRLYFTNSVPDDLMLALAIYYDPLVLDDTGKRLDGTNDTPIEDAIETYLKEDMIFNGLFIPEKLTDRLQTVDGCVIPQVKYAAARYGALPFTQIDAEYNPDAGYLRITDPNNLQILYLPHAPII